MPSRGRSVASRRGRCDRTSATSRHKQRVNTRTKNYSSRKPKVTRRKMPSPRFGAGIPCRQDGQLRWTGTGISNMTDMRVNRGTPGTVDEQPRRMHMDEDNDQFTIPFDRPEIINSRTKCCGYEENSLSFRRKDSCVLMRPSFEEKVLLWIIPLLLNLSLIFTLVSIFTPWWYIVYPNHSNSRGYFGLLEHCGEDYDNSQLKVTCHKRDGKWKFQAKHWPYRPIQNKEYDIILLLLIASIILTLVGILLSLILCCHKKLYYSWLNMIILVVNVIFDIAGASHFEKAVTKVNETATYEHGYSSGLAWAGVGILFVTFMVLIRLLKIQSKRIAKDTVEMVYVGINNDNETYDAAVHFYETSEK